MVAVVYARVSTREQEREGYSIPAQLKSLEEYANKNNLRVIKRFVDVETAKTTGRKAFNEMLNYLKNNQKVKIVLVEKTDRLYRNLKDYITLDELDLQIHLVKEGAILSKDSKSRDKFIHGIMVLLAKNYIDNLSEEVKKGQKERAEQGLLPGKAPYGYKNQDKKIVIDPQAASFVKRAYEVYASHSSITFRKLAKLLLSEGYIYRESRKLCPEGSLNSILDNITYTGRFKVNGITYTGTHEPIITTELYNTVQMKRSKYKNVIRQHRNLTYANFLTCSYCGYAITGCVKYDKCAYYFCNKRNNCQNTGCITEKQLESLIIEKLEELGNCDVTYFLSLPSEKKREFLKTRLFSGVLDIRKKILL